MSRGGDFDLTQRVFDGTRAVLELRAVDDATQPPENANSPPVPEAKSLPEPLTANRIDIPSVPPPQPPQHGKFVGWVESHVGLVTLIVGVLAIIAAIVIAIITTT
jgi:hypothetical protein